MEKGKYWLSGFLLLVVLTSSVYFILNDEVRIDIQKTKSIFQVYENGSWVISGVEYVNLFDGTAKMRAKNRSLETIIGIDNITTVTRIANYKDGISTIEVYTFDATVEDVKLFPISHSIQVINGEGKLLQYEVQKLLYTGQTTWDISSGQSFGHNMEVEWEEGNYYSRIWKYSGKDEGKLTVRYKINSSNYSKNVRLFDPPYFEDRFNSYDLDSRELTIKNSRLEQVVRLKLLTPQENEVSAGYKKVAEYRINPDEAIKLFVSKTETYDKKDSMRPLNRTIDYKIRNVEQVKVNDYETVCKNVLSINGTISRNCTQNLIGFHYEGRVVWNELTKVDFIKGEEIIVGLFTDVQVGDKVEWIPTFKINDKGEIRVPEWAVWTASLNVDLISYFKFDEQDTSGSGNIVDHVGSNDGTNNGADNSSGLLGTAYNYVRANSDYIELPSSLQPVFEGDFTVDFWVFPDTDGVNEIYYGGRSITGSNQGLRVGKLSGKFWTLFDFGSSTWEEFGIFTINSGSWHYFVMRREGTNVSKWMNGNLIDFDDGVGNDANMSHSAVSRFGGRVDETTLWTDGKIDEGGFWDRALSDAEIVQRYNSGTGITPPLTESTPPTFTTIPNNESIVYNTIWEGVVFTGTDETGFGTYSVDDEANFSINSTGYLNVTGLLGVREYLVNVTINDTSGNINWTIYNLNITLGNLTGEISGTTPIIYGTPGDVEGNETNTGDGGVAYKLYRGSVEVSNPDESTLVAGTYDYVYNSTGGANYSANSSIDTFELVINKAIPTGEITGTALINLGTASDVEGNETNTGDGDLTYKLYRNSVEVTNPDISFLDSGIYNYIYNTTGGANYSANSSIDTFTLTVELNGFWYEGNNISSLDLELGTNVNISVNMTGVSLVCIDIDHPDYGINYTCGDNLVNVSFNISYFRKNIFNDSSISKMLNYTGTQIKTIFFPSHQYDEVDSLSFNISGVSNGGQYPENVQINNSNTSTIDRFFPGFLIGDFIYDNLTSEGETFKNLTYSSTGSQRIHLLMDRNSTFQNLIFNITGKEFGFDYEDEFDNYSNIDTILTDAQLDISGEIKAKNISINSYYYDNFDDASLDAALWTSATSNSGSGTSTESITESSGKMIVSTQSEGDGTTKVSIANASSIELYRFDFDSINLSIGVDATWTYESTKTSGGVARVNLGSNVLWSLIMPSKDSGSGQRVATGDIDLFLFKINTTAWGIRTFGEITFTGTNNDRIVPYDNITFVDLDGNSLQFYSQANGHSDGGTAETILNVFNVTQELWNRTNSTVISNSIYDASGDITKATMLLEGAIGLGESIAFFLSADNGDNWESVTLGVEHSFSNTGRNLKWRLDFNVTDERRVEEISYISLVNVSIPKGFPTNISIDFGNDGIADYTRTAELNSSNSPVEVEINLSLVDLTSALSGAAFLGNNLMRVPLEITSSIGQIDVYDINLTYDPNPVFLNSSAIFNYINNSTNFVDFPISIESILGNITIDDIRYDYAGGNDTIEMLAHNVAYSINQSLSLPTYYSRWEYFWGPDNVEWLYFAPTQPTSVNVTPYGQTDTTSILNITNLGYGGLNATLSIYQNGTSTCTNTTMGLNSSKEWGVRINESFVDLVNLSYLETTEIYMWADYNCTFDTWNLYEPLLYFRQCVIGGECSTSLV